MSDASAQPARKKNSVKKWALIVGAVVVLVGAAGAAIQFFAAGAQAGAAGVLQVPQKRPEPIFVSLEQFTVNLADEGGERFAQLAVTLEVTDEKTDKAIRARIPSIRNSVLLLLSSKTTAELLTVEGKKRLAAEIAAQTGATLGWRAPVGEEAPEAPNPVAAVHFSHFIVQ